jgi:uncharacterized protein
MIVDHFWRGLGLVSTGLGLVGAILPLVPTTPFLLVAAYAFARSSPRLHDWLLHHPQFGPLIINWRQHRAISRRVKIASIALMGTMVVAGWFAGMSSLVVTAQAMILGCVALFILTRPNAPRPRETRS